ncbi:MAG TPA: hypothetical protein VL754_04850 [Verrucomicrobiae bacterium]|jgi:hypothetical protein|nr:hypothetical protein [Verrucomicrobiae bacterium]
MLTPEFKKRLGRSHTFVAAVWAALFASCAVAALVPSDFFEHIPVRDNYPYLLGLENLIWGLAIVTAVLLLWSRPRFYSVAAVFEATERPLVVDGIGESPEEKVASRLVYFYRSKMLRALALAESVAFYGLFLAVIEPDDYEWRLFCATAAALLVLFYPSRTFFDELMKEYERRETMREWR